MSNVLIVESPNKVKKIQGFVGSSYIVTSSKGHIRNMDPKKLSIDIDNNVCRSSNIIYRCWIHPSQLLKYFNI